MLLGVHLAFIMDGEPPLLPIVFVFSVEHMCLIQLSQQRCFVNQTLELRDITASLLSDVYHNVATNYHLHPLFGEHFNHKTANIYNEAHLDAITDKFWGNKPNFDTDQIKVSKFRAKTSPQCTIAINRKKKVRPEYTKLSMGTGFLS